MNVGPSAFGDRSDGTHVEMLRGDQAPPFGTIVDESYHVYLVQSDQCYSLLLVKLYIDDFKRLI